MKIIKDYHYYHFSGNTVKNKVRDRKGEITGKRKLYRFPNNTIKFLGQTIPENTGKSIDISSNESILFWFSLVWFLFE